MASEQTARWYARSEGHKLKQIRLIRTKRWGQKEEGCAYGALSNAHGTSVELNYSAYTAVVAKLQVDSQCPHL